jgi:hypothetical protein
MAETFLLAEEKHVQEPFLLHRTRSFRVVRSFHDNCPGSAAPPGDLCRIGIARYVRSGKRAGHVRTERRTADIARRKAATLSPSGAARPVVSPATSGLRRSDLADRRLLPGLISLPPSH